MKASSIPASGKTYWMYAGCLAIVFSLLWIATRGAPRLASELGTVAALGFLLLGGTLLSRLLERVGLPHLSSYLLMGTLAGPYLLHLLDEPTVEHLSDINQLALALIALAGGVELNIGTLREVSRSVTWALSLQCLVGLIVMAGVFVACAPMIPLLDSLGLAPAIGIGLLWGTLAVSRSPSACLAILAQTRAKGPVATHSLASIMASDVVVVVLMACVMVVARPLVEGVHELGGSEFRRLGLEILGSISVGATLGLLLGAYLKLHGRHLIVVLLAFGFGLTEFMHYAHVDPLLAFLTTGFVVRNLTQQGEKLQTAVHGFSSVVFVVFFATAGAHLNLALLQQLWPVATVLCAARALCTFLLARLASAAAKDEPCVKRYGWTSLVSQAGLTLGLSLSVERAFPQFGAEFRALVVATVALNEVVGPILFKYGLDRSGETT